MTLKEGTAPRDATISIEAPSSLPGGYVLDVESGGQIFPVAIPEGGVVQGQTIQTELPLPQPIAPPAMDENVVVIPSDCVFPIPVQTSTEVQSDTPISTTTKVTVTNPDGTQTTTEETLHADGTIVTKSITQSLVNTENVTCQQVSARPKVALAHVPEGAWRTQLCECCNAGKGQCMNAYDILLFLHSLNTMPLSQKCVGW